MSCTCLIIFCVWQVKEESLRKRIRELETELDEARTHHRPDMHHYRLLQAKIYNMETKQVKKERELQEIIDRLKLKHTAEPSNREDYWRDILRNKDLEIQSFREELDAILEVLHELKRQGVMLPNNTHNVPLWQGIKFFCYLVSLMKSACRKCFSPPSLIFDPEWNI